MAIMFRITTSPPLVNNEAMLIRAAAWMAMGTDMPLGNLKGLRLSDESAIAIGTLIALPSYHSWAREALTCCMRSERAREGEVCVCVKYRMPRHQVDEG